MDPRNSVLPDRSTKVPYCLFTSGYFYNTQVPINRTAVVWCIPDRVPSKPVHREVQTSPRRKRNSCIHMGMTLRTVHGSII